MNLRNTTPFALKHLAAHLLLVVGLASATGGASAGTTPLGTTFTYQGQVKQSGAPLNNTADFEFKLFDALSGGAQVGSTNPVSNVNVVDGLFTVSLNFGSGAFNGDQRWLEVRVRSPAGGGNFTTLTPRQPMTVAPFALYALTGPGSGGPWAVSGNNIFTTNTGNVGIGTTSVSAPLHIARDSVPFMLLQDTGPASTQSGYIDFRNNSMVETAWVGFGLEGSPDFSIVNARTNGDILLTPFSGNVGIGTDAPAAKLDVRGSIRLGNSGELLAPGGQENLRIIRGVIAENGSITEGTGFSVSHPEAGRYIVTFNTPFADAPSITGIADRHSVAFNDVWVVKTDLVTAFSAELLTNNVCGDCNWSDRAFHFIAIGRR